VSFAYNPCVTQAVFSLAGAIIGVLRPCFYVGKRARVNNSISSKSSLGNLPWTNKEKDAQGWIPYSHTIPVSISTIFGAKNWF